jgi:hypothetical protein
MSVNGAEELEAGRWLKKQVEAELGDTISGVWSDVIPEGASFPAVKFNVQNSMDVHTVAEHIVMTRLTFQVTGVIEDEKLVELVDIVTRINIALHRRNGETSTHRILSCRRIQTINIPDIEQGRVFRMKGGIYEILIQVK